jgi:nucleoside 2-deoxyribosyltransferase
MKYFISHGVTGENWEELEVIIKNICESVVKSGNEYSNIFLEEVNPKLKGNFEGMTIKDLLNEAYKRINICDGIIVFINSDKKNEGVLIEVGYGVANRKKIILAIRKNVNTHIRDFADEVIEFENLDELYGKLEDLK